MGGRILLAVILGVVLLTFAVGCGKGDQSGGVGSEEPTSAVSLEAHTHAGPRVGEKARVFSLNDIEGNKVSVADMVGKQTLAVVFWGTWCPHCVGEVPALKRIQDAYGEKAFQIVSVAEKQDQAQPLAEFTREVTNFAKDNKLNYPVLLDEEFDAAMMYHLHGVPTIVVIDLDGVMRYIGHKSEEAEKVLKGLLAA